VKGIDLEVQQGELVCLIGANGAGKSTTLRAVCGLLPARSGSVHYGGTDIAGIAIHELPRRGLVMVPEGRGIFAQLTVQENLAMGAYTRSDAGVAQDVERQYETFPRLKERARRSPARSRAASSRCWRWARADGAAKAAAAG
jgi:branched-chain amino acid transport system ATP-binding protein